MKIADLLLRLQQLPPEADVLAYDPDTGQDEPITGYTVEDDKTRIVLLTDDMNVERPRVTCEVVGATHTYAEIFEALRSHISRCLDACGPLGQAGEIPPAVATLHAPNGIVHACERHASTARLQASFLGTHAYMDEAPEGTPCTYCATRAGG